MANSYYFNPPKPYGWRPIGDASYLIRSIVVAHVETPQKNRYGFLTSTFRGDAYTASLLFRPRLKTAARQPKPQYLGVVRSILERRE